MSKFTEMNEKIAETVVEGYKKIEEGVVEGYKKIEEGAVEGFGKVTDKFVETLFTKEGETVEEAKERMNAAQKNVQAHTPNIPSGSEIAKKNLEESLKAGKR